MNTRKVSVLLIAMFLLAATATWAAQGKTPSKPAPAQAATKTAAPAAKSEAAEKPKVHQATGTVVSFTDTSLVISKTVAKKKSELTFVLTPKTKTQGTLAKNAKVTVHYQEEKDQKITQRVKVWEAKPGAKEAAPGAAKKSKAGKAKS